MNYNSKELQKNCTIKRKFLVMVRDLLSEIDVLDETMGPLDRRIYNLVCEINDMLNEKAEKAFKREEYQKNH